MRQFGLARSGLALLVFVLPFTTAVAQSDKLEKAIELFDQQKYVESKQLLDGVNRAQLTDAEKSEFDQMLQTVEKAITGMKRATDDLAAGDKAYSAGQWAAAEQAYNAVLDNMYASMDQRARAAQQRQRILDTRKSGAAPGASSMTPVSGSPGSASASPAQPQGSSVSRPPPAPLPPSGGSMTMTPAGSGVPAPAQTMTTSASPAPPAVSHSDSGPRRETSVDEMRARDDLLWQRAVARMQTLAIQAREAMVVNNYDDARRFADQALQEIEANRIYAEPVERYTTARQTAVALQEEVDAAGQVHAQELAAEQRDEIARRVDERKRLLEQQRMEKIEQLFNTALQLRKENRFDEAAEIYRQILYIEPSNAKAKNYLEIAEDYASFHRQQAWHDDLQIQQRRSLVQADEALIPWDYDVLYPRNWRELTSRREALGAGVSGQALEDIELNKKLEDILPEVRFEEQPFEQVVEFLQDFTKINMSVDWEDLESNGIERDKPVTIKLADLTFRTVLNEVLTQVGGDTPLAFAIGDRLLRVATKDKLDRDKFVLVYDIRDLLVNVPRFTNAAQLDPAQALQAVQQAGQQGGGLGGAGGGGGFGGGGGGAGGQGLFQQGTGNQNEADFDAGALAEEIMDIIRQTVEPDSWRETGGGDASLREMNGQLIVYNTSDSHRRVQDLLSQLRETRALQIALEARYLSVTSNFLEEIGVDIDFVFNSGSAGFDRAFTAGGTPIVDPFTGAPVLVPRQFSQIGSFAATPGFGTPFAPGATPVQSFSQAAFVPSGTGVSPHFGDVTPITAQQGAIALTNPAQFNTTVPGSFAQSAALAPALNIAGSFLDNLQVDFLIRATQANSRSSIVQAPRLLMFNGQRANITVGRGRQYVASLFPVLAEGAVGFQPIPNTAFSGAVLDVEGTISADRKYVTVTVRTTQAEEPDFERFEVQRASGNSPGAFITLIDQRFVSINTTASIPDGGTILLGGLKQVGEIEVEAGVPILSKIPILKRAFTNTTVIKDTRTLLILMKAKILIQREAEEEAFPTFAESYSG